jgi:hypothetical protein
VLRTTRLTLAAPAALLALLLTASGAIAAPPGKLTADPTGPVTLGATGPSRQTVTFKNPDTDGSTAALTATLTGAGFTKRDGCTGTALGPGKSCTVTVSAPSTVPITGATATLTVTPKNPALAPISVSFTAWPPATFSLSFRPLDLPGCPPCFNTVTTGSGLKPGTDETSFYVFGPTVIDFTSRNAVSSDGTFGPVSDSLPCFVGPERNVPITKIFVTGTTAAGTPITYPATEAGQAALAQEACPPAPPPT